MAENVGILAMEIYFPTQFVEQTDLEKYDGVSEGKYTKGLGQLRMGFCAECEDAISMALTVTKRLLDKNNVSPAHIGRMEVGTESGVDRSKSIKSYLMQLFGDNHDICGLDTVQACFGGTQALFNAVDWLTSAAWDGRLAIVVASDVATYPPGPARPTGGAGAVALLLGPNAPLILEPRMRSIYAAHVYDFYKPNPASEYPVVDGTLTISSYLTAATFCYENFARKAASQLDNPNFGLKDVCGVLFHSPYTRLVEKAFSRLVESDVVRGVAHPGVLTAEENAAVRKTLDVHCNGNADKCDSNGCANKQQQFTQPSAELQAAARRAFENLTSPTLWLSREVGNMYTPSLYACLASFLVNYRKNNLLSSQNNQGLPDELRLLLFSYGSGLAAAMFSIRLKVSSPQFALLCDRLSVDIDKRLSHRRLVSPAEFVMALEKRHANFGRSPLDPACDVAITDNLIEGGAFVLEKIDERCRRSYAFVPYDDAPCPKMALSSFPVTVSKSLQHTMPAENGSATGDVLLGTQMVNGMLCCAVDNSPLKNGYHHAD